MTGLMTCKRGAIPCLYKGRKLAYRGKRCSATTVVDKLGTHIVCAHKERRCLGCTPIID